MTAAGTRKFECFDCGKKWEEPYGTGRPLSCPSCGSRNIHRAAEDRGRGGRGPVCARPTVSTGGRGDG
jgi:DNA-directed RNA polymerase subunit RPC12/RpoP